LGSAASFLGKLAATMGRDDLAAEHFERALSVNQALGAPICLARTQADYARALYGGHAHSRADELVAAAAHTAEEVGAGSVARRIAALSVGPGTPV
jgi:hypothetical protein